MTLHPQIIKVLMINVILVIPAPLNAPSKIQIKANATCEIPMGIKYFALASMV